MNSHTSESSCHLLNLFTIYLLNLFTIYSNKQRKMGLSLMTAKVFQKIFLEVPRVWKFHVLLENKMSLLKSSVT